MRDDDTELQVLAYIRAYPRSLIRHVARESGVSYGYVKKNNTKCTHIKSFMSNICVQETDSIRRFDFIALFNTKLYDNPLIVNHILWSDESKFTNNKIMNKQNHRYWDDTNPQWSRETNFQTV